MLKRNMHGIQMLKFTVAPKLNYGTMKGMRRIHSFLDFSAPVPMYIGSYFLLIQAKESGKMMSTVLQFCDLTKGM
jgi:hypothetical protein